MLNDTKTINFNAPEFMGQSREMEKAKREVLINLIRIFGEDFTLKDLCILRGLWMNRSAEGRKRILWKVCPEIGEDVHYFRNQPIDELHVPNEEKQGYSLTIEQAANVVTFIKVMNSNLDKYR